MIPPMCWLRRMCALILLPLLAGCSAPEEPFRVGTNIWIGYEPLYLARAQGDDDDTPIRLVAMSNATEVQRAMRAGMLEAAALTLDEVLVLRQDDLDLRVVLVMDFSNGADVLMARPEITSLEGLRGRRIGVESSAVGAVLLQGALEVAGLEIDDVELVHLAVDYHERAYMQGEVDAVVTFEPVRTQLLNAGAHTLFDSSRIPDRIVDVLVTTAAIAEARGDTLRRLIAGHFAAVELLRQEPLKAAQVMVARQGISAEEIVSSYKGLSIPDLAENRRLLAARHPGLLVAGRNLADLMLERRMLRRPVSVDGMFDDRWLPAQ